MISRYYEGEQFDVETFLAMQVAAFCTSRETLSNPQNLQEMSSKFSLTKENENGLVCKKKRRPGHEVSSCNELHVGVLVRLNSTIRVKNNNR